VAFDVGSVRLPTTGFFVGLFCHSFREIQVSEFGDGERRSRAGILIPATAQVSRRLVWAETVAVGPHVRSVKPGDKVLFNPEDRFEVEVQGEEYVILRERDIHAVASERIKGGTGLYL